MSDHTAALDGITQADLALTGLREALPQRLAFLDIEAGRAVLSIVLASRAGIAPPVPPAVRDRIALRFLLSPAPDLTALREMLGPEGAAALMLDVIRAGHVVSYSGGRRVGCTNTEADGAIWDLISLLRSLPPCGWTAIDSLDWLRGGRTETGMLAGLGLSADSTRAEIAHAAGELVGMAEGAQVALLGRPVKFWLTLAVRRASLGIPSEERIA